MEFPFSRKRLLTPHGSYFLWNVKRKLVMLRWSLLVQTFTSSSSSSHTFFKGEGGGAWSGSRQTGCHKVSQCWEGCSPERRHAHVPHLERRGRRNMMRILFFWRHFSRSSRTDPGCFRGETAATPKQRQVYGWFYLNHF